MATVTNVQDLARAHLAETSAEMWTDAILLPFTQRAYRKAARALRTTGMGLFAKEAAFITMTAGKVAIVRSGGTPTYPSDLIRPIQLKERLSAGPGAYSLMSNCDGFVPPTIGSNGTFDVWNWFNDIISVPAAAVSRDIVILYDAELPAVTVVGDSILIPDCLDALALMVASQAARSRDETQHAQDWWAQAMEDLQQIAKSEERVKRAQGAAWGTK